MYVTTPTIVYGKVWWWDFVFPNNVVSPFFALFECATYCSHTRSQRTQGTQRAAGHVRALIRPQCHQEGFMGKLKVSSALLLTRARSWPDCQAFSYQWPWPWNHTSGRQASLLSLSQGALSHTPMTYRWAAMPWVPWSFVMFCVLSITPNCYITLHHASRRPLVVRKKADPCTSHRSTPSLPAPIH